MRVIKPSNDKNANNPLAAIGAAAPLLARASDPLIVAVKAKIMIQPFILSSPSDLKESFPSLGRSIKTGYVSTILVKKSHREASTECEEALAEISTGMK